MTDKPILSPTFDTPGDFQAVFVGSATGHYPSWWSWPDSPNPLIYASQSQSQSQSQPNDSAPESLTTKDNSNG
jgi:hypothetical protein